MFDPSKLDLDPEKKSTPGAKDAPLDAPEVTPQDPLENMVEKNTPTEDVTEAETITKSDPTISKEPDVVLKEVESSEPVTPPVLFDINITKLHDILHILLKEEYDFATLEPKQEHIEIIFKKDKIKKDTKNISYPTYAKILIESKTSSGLDVTVSNEQQE